MAPPPRRTNDAIGTRATIEPAAGRVRVYPEDNLDILTGALDVDAPIAGAKVLDLVPLEQARVKRSEDDVRVVRVELARVPAHHDLFAGPPSRRGGSRGWRVGTSW